MGTIFSVSLNTKQSLKFILVECNEEDSVFQLVCIEGYHAGQIYGFIKRQFENENSVDKIHLKEQLIWNVANIDEVADIIFEVEK